MNDPKQSMQEAYRNGLWDLSDGNWVEANNWFDTVLRFDSKHDHAYIGKLCCELRINTFSHLDVSQDPHIAEKNNYEMALQHSTEPLKSALVHFSNIHQLQGDYKTACRKSKKASTYEQLRDVADLFSRLGDYKESKEQAVKYSQKAINRKNRSTKIVKIASVSAVIVVVAVAVLFFTVIIPASKYSYAEGLFADGKYIEAMSAYNDMGDYKNSKEKALEALEARYQREIKLNDEEKYDEAVVESPTPTNIDSFSLQNLSSMSFDDAVILFQQAKLDADHTFDKLNYPWVEEDMVTVYFQYRTICFARADSIIWESGGEAYPTRRYYFFDEGLELQYILNVDKCSTTDEAKSTAEKLNAEIETSGMDSWGYGGRVVHTWFGATLLNIEPPENSKNGATFGEIIQYWSSFRKATDGLKWEIKYVDE